MAKILVVDDEIDLQFLIQQKFRKQIKAKKYDFVFALNGVEALAMIEAEPDVDIVLSDINMPEMDGLTLLTHISESSPLIKSVIVSAYGDMDNIRTAMNRGAFDFITKPINFEDLNITMEKTLSHVEQIKNTLKAIKENDILKMYVDETVINFMGGREFESSIMASETIEASVMFVDICGFTSISENAAPADVVRFLNTYFDVMAKAILDKGGQIDKFIGDAVMAIFKGEDHLAKALEAALALKKEVNGLPPLIDSIDFSPKVSIGVNSGEMVSGNIGSESLRRLDYTVIGANVNIAQRLESVAEENQIIISEASYEKIKDKFKCEEVGSVVLKNLAESVKIFNVVG